MFCLKHTYTTLLLRTRFRYFIFRKFLSSWCSLCHLVMSELHPVRVYVILQNSVVRLKKIWGKTVRGHANSWKTRPLWNKGKLLLSKIVQESASKKKEREVLNRWTEHCSELYNHKANGHLSIMICSKTDTWDDHPILRKEVWADVQSLKKGKSARVDNIPAELVKEGREDVITALTTICNKIW